MERGIPSGGSSFTSSPLVDKLMTAPDFSGEKGNDIIKYINILEEKIQVFLKNNNNKCVERHYVKKIAET